MSDLDKVISEAVANEDVPFLVGMVGDAAGVGQTRSESTAPAGCRLDRCVGITKRKDGTESETPGSRISGSIIPAIAVRR